MTNAELADAFERGKLWIAGDEEWMPWITGQPRFKEQIIAALRREPDPWKISALELEQRDIEVNAEILEAMQILGAHEGEKLLQLANRIAEREPATDALWDEEIDAMHHMADELDEDGMTDTASWLRDTARRLVTYRKAQPATDAVLEMAAKVCEQIWKDAPNDRASGFRQNEISHGCVACANAIRALKGKGASQDEDAKR